MKKRDILRAVFCVTFPLPLAFQSSDLTQKHELRALTPSWYLVHMQIKEVYTLSISCLFGSPLQSP